MTKPKGEDLILDYIYHELSGEELAAFERRLAEEPELRAEVESFSRVREVYKKSKAPRVTHGTAASQGHSTASGMSQEAAQRMTALLMQEATAAAGKATEQSGGGKLLSLKPRAMKRVFMGPASGIFAAAAAALFWVVFRTQSPQSPAPAPTAATVSAPISNTATIGPAADVAQVPVPIQKELQEEGKAQAKGALVDGYQDGTAAKPPAAKEPSLGRGDDATAGDRLLAATGTTSTRGAGMPKTAVATASPEATPTKPAEGRAAQSWTGWRTESKATATTVPALPTTPPADAEYAKKAVAAADKDKDSNRDSRNAAPPPPPAPVEAKVAEAERSGLDEVIESGKARRKAKVVEDLADQELAAMPRGGAVKADKPAPDRAPLEQRAHSADDNRYAQAYRGREEQNNDSVGAGAGASPSQQGYSNYGGYPSPQQPAASAPPAAGPMPAATPPPVALQTSQSNYGSDHNGSALLTQVQDALRRGHCDEAAEILRKAEAGAAAAAIPEARAAYERQCVARPFTKSPAALPSPEPAAVAPSAPATSVERQFAAPPRRAAVPQQTYSEKAGKRMPSPSQVESAENRASMPAAKPSPAKAKRATKAAAADAAAY